MGFGGASVTSDQDGGRTAPVAAGTRSDQPSAAAALLARVAARDRAALRQLYDMTNARLFGIALAILRDRDAAADAVQEAYVKVWLRADQYDPARGNALAWLSGITRHVALDAARARGREVTSDEALLDVPSLEPGAFDMLSAESDARRLQACLAELDDRSRGVIVLAFVHGLSHAQLALRLNHPLGTVKTWIRGGLKRLRACLADTIVRA